MALYLYLQFPSLLPDSLCTNEQQALPVAIVSKQHRIVQLNALAACQGVKLDMGLATAAALCPQLQVLPYQSERQQRILTALAQRLYRHSSDIALDLPDGLFLHLSPVLTLYRGLLSYWQSLEAVLAALPYRYYFACGNTPFAAKLLAKQQFNKVTDQAAELKEAVKRSPLAFSELEAKTQLQLQRLGVQTVGQLMALPDAELARRFDAGLLSYLGRLRGDFYHALSYIQPQPGFSVELELLYDITDTAVLTKTLLNLLQQLQHFLSRHDAVCHQLTLLLCSRSAKPLQLSIHSAQGEYRADDWLKLCQLHLQKVQLKQPVSGLSLQVSQLMPQQVLSSDLFSQQQSAETALQLVSRLQARLGHQGVSGLMLQNQHLPEHASNRPLPLLSGQNSATALKLRPAFLLTRPQALHEDIEISQGPERLCPNGWALSAQRDYFIGRSAKGQWLWLFRTREQRWYVHGLFS